MTLKINNLTINNPFVLAPMAGVNCTSHRLLCREYGASLVYTQMYHSEFLLHKFTEEGKQSVFDLINIQKQERPVAIQLVGSEPDKMAKAAVIVQEIADIIDINCGCCDPGLIKSKSGGYLSKDLELMGNIVKSVINATNIPVTAKIRIGWDSQNINGVRAAQILESLGVSAIAVHGRTVNQKYSGKANWQIIKQIKNKVTTPIIGNGDVRNTAKAVEMLDKTKCDFVMIARRTKGDPSFFRRCLKKYNKEHQISKPIPESKELFIKFLRYYKKFDSSKSFTELKAHAMWFAKRACIGPKKREIIAHATTEDEIEEVFKVF
ncbi:MAG: tRNA dihydrouridine synthase [Nanobdellota archaeon]